MNLRNLQEAIVYFSNEENAFNTMKQLRWEDGVVDCPHCESTELWFMEKSKLWKCKTCRKNFSIKVGTLMEDSRLGLDKWLCAIWLLANSRNGTSSYEIARSIGITQMAAWFLLHRIRQAMATGTFRKMEGTVEVDETFVGGKAKNMHLHKRKQIQGRGGVGKAIVLGMLERNGNVSTKVITDTKRATLHGEVKKNVHAGAKVYSDAFKAYNGLSKEYVHEKVDHTSGEYVRGDVHTNGIENFWSLLKRSINGTYVSVSPKHLHRYCQEQTFRYNERKQPDVERFKKAASGLAGRRLTYKSLTAKERVQNVEKRQKGNTSAKRGTG